MAEKGDKPSIFWTILKIIFACLLLTAVMSGYFVAGANTLSGKMANATHAYLSADMLLEGEKGKK